MLKSEFDSRFGLFSSRLSSQIYNQPLDTRAVSCYNKGTRWISTGLRSTAISSRITIGIILNYAISRLLSKAYELDTEPRYEKINSAVGVTECVKLELYRRLAAPYEDKAIDKNGDIEEYKEKNE